MDNCNYHNPQRVPEWRWNRAIGCLDGTQPRPSLRRDGPLGNKWIRKAIGFRQALRACRTDLDRYALSERVGSAPMYWAYQLWSDDSPLKWTVESLILAREDDYAIGFNCGMDPKVVAAYEATFFNVRDRLQHQQIIIKSLLRGAMEHGPNMRNLDLIWKLYAYLYGPEMFLAVSNGFVNPAWVNSADGVNTAVENDATTTMKLKAMLAAKTVPVTPQTQMELINAFTAFVEIERSSEASAKAENQLMEHISAMMVQLPFDVGGVDPRAGHVKVDRGLTAKFRQTAVELTFEENLRGATGQDIPSAEALIDVTYPPRLTTTPAGG